MMEVLGVKLQLRLQISLKNKWGEKERHKEKKDPLQEREEFRECRNIIGTQEPR